MTEPSTSRAARAEGPGEQVPIAGTDLAITVTMRAAVGELELIGRASLAAVPRVADAVAEIGRDHPGVRFHLAAEHPVDTLEPLPEAVADAAGYPHRRDLLQLRRALPVPFDHPARAAAPPVAVRSIDLGIGGAEAHAAAEQPWTSDVGAWLRANNRAFAHHPDQGAESVATFLRRLDVEWSDPSGFLVADDPDRPGELSGFCWTKVHPATAHEPVLGEIYVIGVDPSHQGEHLGPSFVLAGLDVLAAEGVAVANLYVDADNEPARRLYDRLGFTAHRRRRVYSS